MTTDSVQVTLHNSQALIQIINANVTYCAWPRAGGKTGGGIGPRLQYLSETMPRAQILLFSDTYERLVDRIIPNIIDFLQNKLKLVEGEDFVKYKKPPENWEKPLIPLDKFDRVISFATGTALCLVSLTVEGSANAYNAQAAIGDEIKFCDEEKIDTEVMPALRGAQKEFGHLPEYLSVWMFTDKYGPKIKWYLKKKKLVNQTAVEIVYALQMQIIALQNEIAANPDNQKLHFENSGMIRKYKEKLNRIRKHLVYYSDMKPYENLQTLGDFFFKRARRICKSEYMYNVAYLNHDPDKIEHTFYPTFDQQNKYKGIIDYDPLKPFIIAMDYNWRISPMPVAQISKIPGNNYTTLNFIDYLYELHPKGIEDTIDSFCKKYEHHFTKEIHYICDHTAIGRTPTKRTFSDVVTQSFNQHGWRVIMHYTGDAPDHDIKFENIKKWLTQKSDYAIRVNEITCDQLIKSIEQSPAITSGGVTKKDKRTEKNINFPAEDSTHGSDAFDQVLWGIFELDVRYKLTATATPIRIG